MFERLVTL